MIILYVDSDNQKVLGKFEGNNEKELVQAAAKAIFGGKWKIKEDELFLRDGSALRDENDQEWTWKDLRTFKDLVEFEGATSEEGRTFFLKIK